MAEEARHIDVSGGGQEEQNNEKVGVGQVAEMEAGEFLGGTERYMDAGHNNNYTCSRRRGIDRRRRSKEQ